MEKAEEIRYGIGNKQIYQLRKETIERIFGTAKEQHGFRYTQYIGKARMGKSTDGNESRAYLCMHEFEKTGKDTGTRGKIKSSISYIFKNESKYWLYNEKWCWEISSNTIQFIVCFCSLEREKSYCVLKIRKIRNNRPFVIYLEPLSGE